MDWWHIRLYVKEICFIVKSRSDFTLEMATPDQIQESVDVVGVPDGLIAKIPDTGSACSLVTYVSLICHNNAALPSFSPSTFDPNLSWGLHSGYVKEIG